MLKNIKTTYFIKLLFSFIIEKHKLKIIKYNKSLQKNINISIINYKFMSTRYIIYESNGIGKEYEGYNDQLIYEGEYLNGEKNGKGKEYNIHGNLVFEGEYSNGEKVKGKGYDKNGNIIYVIKKQCGINQEYDDNCSLIFEG